jgi:cytochrome c oxidase subunit 4
MESPHDDHAGEHGHIVPYGTLLQVWLVLLGLTALLVAVSRWKHEALSVWAMLTVTPLKAALVLWFFMHLKYEKPLFRGMLFVTLALLVLFIGLLFLDVSFR